MLPATGNTEPLPTLTHLVKIVGQCYCQLSIYIRRCFVLFFDVPKQKRVSRSGLRWWMDLSRVFCLFLARTPMRYRCYSEWEFFEIYLKVSRWHLWDTVNLRRWFWVWYVILWRNYVIFYFKQLDMLVVCSGLRFRSALSFDLTTWQNELLYSANF